MNEPIDLAYALGWGAWIFRELVPIRNLGSYLTESRPLNRLLDPFARSGEPCLIVLPSLNLPKEMPKYFVKEIEEKEVALSYTEPLMSTYDSIAASYFHSILSRAGKKTDEVIVKQDEDLSDDEMNENIVCIGLWSNSIANMVNKKSPYFKFESNGKLGWISSSSNPNLYYDKEKNLSYGLLLKLWDAFHKKKAVIVAGGLSPDATAAAAYHLYSEYKDLAKKYSKSSFGEVIKINTDIGYKSARRYLEWKP